MKIASEHVQPMSLKVILRHMLGRGKSVFRLSLVGNLLIIALFSFVLFALYNYIESLGASESQLVALSTINNMLFISFTSANVFYLLIGGEELPFGEQVKQSLIKTLKITHKLLAATLIFSGLMTLGLGLLLIPGLIIFTYFGIYSQTIIFENQGVVASLSRSFNLVKGSFWKTFGILIGLYLLTNIFLLVPTFIVAVFVTEFSIWLEVIVYCITYMVMMPFIASSYVLLYFDLRSRKESFDYTEFVSEREKVVSS